MARIVDGIKELIKGKEEPEYEYRYRRGYDQRQAPESVRYYGYPGSGELEARRGYRGSYGESGRRGKSFRYGSRREDDDDDVIELMVPMCCDKCEEKVEEELGEVEGVEFVHCDQTRGRVTVRGNNIDTDRCLVKAERAVKKKCELLDDGGDSDENRSSGGYRSYPRGGRPSLGRLPSFASGRTVYDDGVGPRGRDYEERDYRGFRRMPSLRYHEAEYITPFQQEPRDSRRDYYAVRRMPSFRNHRYHDAEYVTVRDPEYAPRSFYERDAGSPYTTVYDDRPAFRSQVSFSRLPVRNPGYVKHIDAY